MDAIPEKFYYVPLPQLRRLRMPHRPRLRRSDLPRLGIRDLSAVAVIGRGLRGHPGRRVVEVWASHRPHARVVERWWASHKPDSVVWMLGIASAVVVAVVVARL